MTVRKAAVAGTFYPADVNTLTQDINSRLNDKAVEVNGYITALIAPHAGYVFSGDVAGAAYKLLTDKSYDTIVIISPSHREAFPYSSIMKEGFYETPLGQVKINSELSTQLSEKSPTIKLSDKGHFSYGGSQEHALEVHIPFLQVCLADEFELVPIVMGDQSWENSVELGKALAETIASKSVLIVASSDLSHFHNDAEARKLDGFIVDSVKNYDVKKLYDHIRCKDAEACGYGPMIAAMTAAKILDADKSSVLDYATSADSPYGDNERVVGYVSAVFYKEDV